MPWYLPWTDVIKKKVCRYLLQRYLGQFLDEKLSLEQLNVDLYNGTGTVNDIALYSESINELFQAQGWPLEVIEGHLGSVTVNIPWNALMTEDSFIQVTNLYFALKPKPVTNDGTSVLESMWSSMSSSMQLAQDCLDNENNSGDSILEQTVQTNAMEGLERFAQTIDNVLKRVKVKLLDTIIRLEYLLPNAHHRRGIAIIIKIKNIEYQNEAGNDPPDKDTSPGQDEKTSSGRNKSYFLSTHTIHHIIMDAITFYTEEFVIIDDHTMQNECRSDDDQDLLSNITERENMASSEQFHSTISNIPSVFQQSLDSINEDEQQQSDEILNFYKSDEIIFAKMIKRQEIRIKMKQAENIYGPKVELDINFGSFEIFLTPRQLHLLICLSNIFLNDAPIEQTAQDKSNSDIGEGDVHIEPEANIELQQTHYNPMTGVVGLNHGWSSNLYDDNKGVSTTTYSHDIQSSSNIFDSVLSSSGSMTTSSISSASATNNKRKGFDLDSSVISRFNVRIASFMMIILHEDILVDYTSSIARLPLTKSSVDKMKKVSEDFFTSLSDLNLDFAVNDITKLDTNLNTISLDHHLRLLLTPIIIEGEEQRNAKENLLQIKISIARCQFNEMLKDVTIPLIEFHRDVSSSSSTRSGGVGNLPKRPEISINFQKMEKIRHISGVSHFSLPNTLINFNLAPCLTEIDISIYDRLKALLDESIFIAPSSLTPKHKNRSHKKTNKKQGNNNMKFESNLIDVKLRFPIPDLRPLHDPQRVPWWKRNVRPDYLLIKLENATMSNVGTDGYNVEAKEINLFYNENDKAPSIHVGKCCSHIDGKTQIVQLPNFFIEIITSDIRDMSQLLQERTTTNDESENHNSSGESIDPWFQKKLEPPTPFSSKRVCRESDTPHKKQTNDDTETLIIPGDSTEIAKFCDFAYKNSKIKVKLNFPVVSLQLKSKHLYEVLYNRINSDLLLWEPASSSVLIQQSTDNFLNVGMMDSIYAPMYGAGNDRDYASSPSTSSSETEDETNNIFYSVYDRKKTRLSEKVSKQQPSNNCDLSVELKVSNGILTMFSPVRDSQNHVIPEQFGEYVIKFNSFSLFLVKGYCDNENLGYVCLQTKSADVYHCGIIPSPSPEPPLRLIDSLLPDYLVKTLYPTPRGLTMKKCTGSKNREMLVLAIQIKACPDQRLKRIRVAAGIQLITLKHNPSLPEHTWLTELIDMFDVLDYPIPGYTASGVVTEMHLHLWDCAIDYRPLYFPYRAVITLGNFMISSNITTASPGCTLRFVAEDCTLCLAPQKFENSNSEEKNEVQELSLKGDFRDLVCLVELGLFEISLRLNEKATTFAPKFDLRAAINDIHIRTCADSARALAELISYVASEGDLNKLENSIDDTNSLNLKMNDPDTDLLSVKSETHKVPEVTQSQQLHVNTLMAEAMVESTINEDSEFQEDDCVKYGEGIDVFFFPDEAAVPGSSSRKVNPILDENAECSTPDTESLNSDMRELFEFETSVMGMTNKRNDEEVEEALPQVTKDLGDVSRKMVRLSNQKIVGHARKISSDTDEDFCIISEEEKVTFVANPKISVNPDPIRIIDNHFSVPSRKPDLLQAPPDFPMAVIRYTLCEMSIVWHIYGGLDFAPKIHEPNHSSDLYTYQLLKSGNLPMSEAYKFGVSYSKGSPTLLLTSNKALHEKLTWKTKGGPQRKHDVLMEFQLNKVRFSHESYPNDTEQASRQVLLISELEIKDKLAISNINKFLYHQASGSMKSHKSAQNMIVVKALHLRSDLSLSAQECCLRISMLPLRLNIDQDSLLFLVSFFQEFSGADNNESTSRKLEKNTPAHPPIMMVDLPEAAQELQARKMVSENLMLLMEEEEKVAKQSSVIETEDNLPIYFRSISFSPDVSIRIDYQGKRVELSHGPLAGLLMGLGQLQCSEIRLKKICHKHGILGVDKLLNFLLQEWLQDIKRNQLPSLLGGVGPMYSFIQLFQGIRDLFWLPIEQYQKDGQIVRGLQRGAQSFTARTALAALEITTRIIHLLQITAETAYDMVSPGPSVRRGRGYRKGKRKRIQPPQDIREGVANAYQIMKEGIGETAHTIMEVASLEHDQKGYTGAVGAVVRQIPSTVVKPIVLATQATSNVLGGVKNQLVPDARKEAKDKWKDDED